MSNKSREHKIPDSVIGDTGHRKVHETFQNIIPGIAKLSKFNNKESMRYLSRLALKYVYIVSTSAETGKRFVIATKCSRMTAKS